MLQELNSSRKILTRHLQTVETKESGHSIDQVVHDLSVNVKSNTGAVAGWVVEYDGPYHFLVGRSPLCGTLMKRRHLQLLRYTVVSLPYWEWDLLKKSDKRKIYVKDKLHIS